MNVLIFDIETAPDIEAGKKLYPHNFDNLTDKEVAQTLLHLREQETGKEFMPHYLQQIVTISAVLRTNTHQQKKILVWSLGTEASKEPELIQRFFEGVDKFKPTLVSWNGSGFDLPVLQYRSLIHGITAKTYWENGERDTNFRYNNYLSRYHYRHIDLMDILSCYQSQAKAPLDKISQIIGFPGKMDQSGAQVWQQYFDGQITAIRNYCETDVLNTYLLFLRFQINRGHLTQEGYQEECQLLKQYLCDQNKEHFNQFIQAWKNETTLYHHN